MCFLFAFTQDESKFLHCSPLALPPAAAVFFPFSPPPPSAPLSPLLRAASPLVSWPVNDVVAQRDTFNEGVYVREAHTEGRFVVSRAFSLAPEALAKSAVRFGSLHRNTHTHTQSNTHTNTVSLSSSVLIHISLFFVLTNQHTVSSPFILSVRTPTFSTSPPPRKLDLL